jgi:hypothetical protein
LGLGFFGGRWGGGFAFEFAEFFFDFAEAAGGHVEFAGDEAGDEFVKGGVEGGVFVAGADVLEEFLIDREATGAGGGDDGGEAFVLIDESEFTEDLADAGNGGDGLAGDADFEFATEEDVEAGVDGALFDDDIFRVTLEEAGGVEDVVELLFGKTAQEGNGSERGGQVAIVMDVGEFFHELMRKRCQKAKGMDSLKLERMKIWMGEGIRMPEV